MRVNILTTSEECEDLLTYLYFSPENLAIVKFIQPEIAWEYFQNRCENSFGWNAWIKIFSYSFLNNPNNNIFKSGQPYDVLDTNFYPVNEFIKSNQQLNAEKLQSLFFKKQNDIFLTVDSKESFDNKLKMGIHPGCFGITLEFIYSESSDGDLHASESIIAEAYEQLKVFYTSFSEKYSDRLLYILPHYDPLAEDEKFFLFHGFYPGDYGDYSTREEEWDSSDGWSELGREEEERMDDETDGFWRVD